MGFIDFSVKRIVAIICLIIALSALGINSYRKLPLEELPKTDVPYVTVVTIYPGATPEEIETDIAKPVEDAVGTIDGLKHITSSSMENVCQTLLEFKIGIDVDTAANDVREKLDLIINDFPEGVEKPKVLKFDVNAQPIINLALTGDIPLENLFDYADNDLRDRLSTIAGVADIQLIGGATKEVRVLLDRKNLAARGLTSLDIVTALKKEIRLIPSGRIRDTGFEYTVKFDADFTRIEDIGNLEIANKEGARCYLRDVGTVKMSTEEVRQLSTINGKPSVAIKIVKKAEANAVEVVEQVKKLVKDLVTELPGGMQLIWISDMGNYNQSSVNSAISNIWQGILLTSILIFLFLYNFRSTIIVAITMPLTIIIGIFFIYLIGYSLNTTTLLALGLSIGILVTNSIVVLESIITYLGKKDTNAESASIDGAKNVFIAVLASAGTNIVVLFPISMMKGIVGQFFIPFALTMVGITAISLAISFTLTPAMSAKMLNKEEKTSGLLKRIETKWNSGFDWFSQRTASLIARLMKNRSLSVCALILSFLLLIHALSLIPKIGLSFLPITDKAELIIKLEFPTSYSLNKTALRTREIEKLLKDLPDLQHALVTIGKTDGTVGQTSEGVHLSQIFCKFKEKMYRKISLPELIKETRNRLSGLPDVISTVIAPDPMGAGAEVKMVIMGSEFDKLDQIGLNLASQAASISLIADVDTSIRPGKPELRIKPKRAILSDVKVPATALGMVLRTNLEGAKAGTFKQGARTYDIRVKLKEQEGLSQISELEMPGMPGHPVILENFASIKERRAPILITRRDKSRAIMFYANLRPGAPLGEAAQAIKKILSEKIGLPQGYTAKYFGKIEAMKEGQADFVEVGVTAFILTFLLMAAILDSFKRPIIILLTIPLGLMGCLWALYLTGEAISMMVLLGGVMLIGIVVNNAILIMDQVQSLISEGSCPHKAMITTIKDKLRPITMITLAAIFGMLPMAIDSTLGSELRSGIGYAAIGGIAVSAIFTMIMLPVIFGLFNKPKDQ